MAIAVLKVKGLLVEIARLSPPLFCTTRPLPRRPTTLPPMERVPVEHVICTTVTAATAVPLPLATVQVCGGLVGGVKMETLKGLPLATAVLNAKVPFPVTVRLSAALSC